MKKKWTALLLCLALCLTAACGSAGGGGAEKKRDTEISKELPWTDSMKLEYAQKFTVDNYEGGYELVTIADDGRFLVVPEGKEALEGLDADFRVLQQPLDISFIFQIDLYLLLHIP